MSSLCPVVPGSARSKGAPLTLEEIDSLIAVVAVGREGKRCIHIVGDALKALGDVPWVPRVQGSVVKAPVLGALGSGGQRGVTGQHPPATGLSAGASTCWGTPLRGCGYLGSQNNHRDLGYLAITVCVCTGGARRGYRLGRGAVLATLGVPPALLPTLNR